jgi:alpha-tubulin suppressor-like RCC1 family protein
MWSWGQNTYGQLGLGNTAYYSSPKQVGALTAWLDVSAGTGTHILAISN